MVTEFDPGYVDEPIRWLVQNYPRGDIYPPADFRVEWGPVFHRGRLDGSASVLVIGQEPSPDETIVRRVCAGVTGRRVQGFLAKLGVTRSYVMLNAFLYGALGQGSGEKYRNDPRIAAYRNQWLDALLVARPVQAVVALDSLADTAWKTYRMTPRGKSLDVAYYHIRQPMHPERSSNGDAKKYAEAMSSMLAQWNLALAGLQRVVTRTDVSVPFVPYGDTFRDEELIDIPACDLPAGTPEWMRTHDGWARPAAGRATLTVQVPQSVVSSSPVPHAVAHGVVMHAAEPVDPPTAGRLALRGRVVTMNALREVHDDMVVYLDRGTIVALRSPSAPPPAGFADVERLETRGTIFPGMIELHNHLPYNVLRLWKVPKKYTDRNVWRRSKEYHASVVAPMSVLAEQTSLAVSIARYVECKTLLGGVTTSQGITLINSGVTSKFRGLVRNVEQTDETALPEAATNVSDVGDLKEGLAEFVRKLARAERRGGCLLHHLSEGTDPRSRGHFTALQGPNGDWALSPALAGIHAVALDASDLDVMARHGAGIVWSPLSNLLLYGRTANIRAARERGIRIALGSDWSPSGSKNLLGELKAARAASDVLDLGLDDLALVEMVTSNPASLVRWDRQLGSIEVGKKADLFVISGKAGPARGVYGQLVRARESDIKLVVINGARRYGTAALMKQTQGTTEALVVGGRKRRLDLGPLSASPLPGVTLADARRQLSDAMQNLPALAKAQDSPAPHGLSTARAGFRIVLDELSSVPGSGIGPKTVAPKASTIVPLTLDPLSACDDPEFHAALAAQINVSEEFKTALAALYKG